MALLRASSEAVSANEAAAVSLAAGEGVEAGPELVRFATAAVTGGASDDLSAARAALRSVAGDAGLVEAAATVSVFEGLNRIADATGIQLDDGLDAESADFRSELGIEGFGGAVSTGERGIAAERATSVADMFT